MTSGNSGFILDSLEHKICRVDLAMRMRIGDADNFALVFEDQYVADLGTRAEIRILFTPCAKQRLDLGKLKLRQSQIVP